MEPRSRLLSCSPPSGRLSRGPPRRSGQAVERSPGRAAPRPSPAPTPLPQTYQWPTPAAPKRTLEAKLFLGSPVAARSATPAPSAINAALDALDAALVPAGR